MAVVTVSRQYGSGGRDIARAVAEVLGARYVDREIIGESAQRIGVPEDIASARDERIQPLSERLMEAIRLAFSGVSWSPGRVPPRAELPLTDAQMIEVTRAVIREAARGHNAVIVGRGAQMVLAGERGALHVHVVAPLADRVQRVMRRRQLSSDEAKQLIDKVDGERATYLQSFYQADWEDPLIYHLVLDTGLLSPELAVQTIAVAAATLDEGLHPPTPPNEQTRLAIERLVTELRTMRDAARESLERYRTRGEW